MVEHTQTIRRQQPTNCLSVSEYFVGLGLKGFTQHVKISLLCPIGLWLLFFPNTYPKNKSNILRTRIFLFYQIFKFYLKMQCLTKKLTAWEFHSSTAQHIYGVNYAWEFHSSTAQHIYGVNYASFDYPIIQQPNLPIKFLSNKVLPDLWKKNTRDVYYSDLNFVAFLQKFP